jgi:hypothetical protein
MDADMGSTEIAKPLEQVYSLMQQTIYNRNIFIITDGQVANTE